MSEARRLASGGPSGTAAVADLPCSLQLEPASSAIYREYGPPPPLERLLVCAWTLEIGAGDCLHRQRILPDGCSDIVWIGEAAPIVVGPMTRSALSASSPGTTLVGLRFRPQAAASVFGVPAHELVDRHVALEELWQRRIVEEASQRLFERRTAAGRVSIAWSLLASRHQTMAACDRLIEHAVTFLSKTPRERIDALVDVVGVSDRHLRRRFLSSVGYSPKLFQRIVRFQRLLALARAHRSTRLGDLAVLGGYADQAHMTREVSEFAGVRPSALFGNVMSALTLSEILSATL